MINLIHWSRVQSELRKQILRSGVGVCLYILARIGQSVAERKGSAFAEPLSTYTQDHLLMANVWPGLVHYEGVENENMPPSNLESHERLQTATAQRALSVT